jgi:hypothetical protein
MVVRPEVDTPDTPEADGRGENTNRDPTVGVSLKYFSAKWAIGHG